MIEVTTKRIDGTERVLCPFCDRTGPSLAYVASHIRRAHGKSERVIHKQPPARSGSQGAPPKED